ncbi:N-acetylmuramoyl-L-alanine amidase [Tissierella carlieri]|uniref:N-acetylmuramoyl-L-alanine amidase n=1 Tax=Tissierella carlieri TaxID=689904 RepID=A0ABT1S6S6_9FIRM|nr:N-acetylmuramoyl-L-alanine amidase [Tissierella carlieri]MCQ4922179.1 N-acetylmuramoyl-L-alanine amidase [Tissierella carlieri]
MTKSIYLSPSTQEKNIGYGNYGSEEMRMNQVADVVEKILIKHGVKVYRNKPDWDLKEVVKDSNLRKPNLHFAIHSNAGGGRGAEVFAYSPQSEGAKAANTIYNEFEKITLIKGRGVKFNSKFYELNSTNAPAILIEVAFHDNLEDANWIINNIEKIGVSLAKGVLKYFNIPFKESSEENSKVLYRVMVGSFSKKENARQQVERLKKAGFDSVIMPYKA